MLKTNIYNFVEFYIKIGDYLRWLTCCRCNNPTDYIYIIQNLECGQPHMCIINLFYCNIKALIYFSNYNVTANSCNINQPIEMAKLYKWNICGMWNFGLNFKYL